MGKIYDLTQQQNALYDSLFWEDEDSEAAEQIRAEILKVHKSAESTLRFLSTIYAESRATDKALDAAMDAAIETLTRRRNKSKNATERLKELIASTMKTFDIKKIEGEFVDITLLKDSESLQYADDFDIDSLPYDCKKSKIVLTPIPDAIKKHLHNNEVIEGVHIVKKTSIRMS